MECGGDAIGHVKEEGQRKPVLVFRKTTVGLRQEVVVVARPACGPGHQTYAPSSGPPSPAHLLGLSETIRKVRKMQEIQDGESKGTGALRGRRVGKPLFQSMRTSS